MFRFNNPDALLVLLLTSRRVRACCGPSRRRAPAGWSLAGVLRRLRLPDQDAAGVPGAARRSRCVYLVAAPGRRLRKRIWRPAGRRRRRWSSPRGWWVAIVELVAGALAGPTSAARRTTDPGADPRLQRLRPARPATRPAASAGGGGGSRRRHVGRDRHRPGCSTPSSAARSSWLLPAALVLLVAGLVAHRAGRRAPTATRAALLLWGGWLVVTGAGLQLHGRASSTTTTRSPWPRRSPRWSASGVVGCGGAASTRRPPATLGAGHRALTAVVVVRAARPHADWLPWLRVAGAGRRPRRRRWRCAGLRWHVARRVAAGRGGRGRAWSVAGRAARRTRSSTVATAAHRRHPDRRPDGRRRRFGPGGGGSGGRSPERVQSGRPADGPPGGAAAAPAGHGAGGPGAGRRPASPGGGGGGGGRAACSAASTPSAELVSGAAARTPTPTPGSPRRSAPTTPPATSWPPASR